MDGAEPSWRWARMGIWAHAQTPRSPTGLLDGVRHAKASREQLQNINVLVCGPRPADPPVLGTTRLGLKQRMKPSSPHACEHHPCGGCAEHHPRGG